MKRRNTPSKEVIFNLLANTGKAMSRDAIEQKIDVEIDRATIYRILNRFCEDGLVHKIVAEDGKQYFAICIKCDEKSFADNHFHFRCVKCQTIECLPEAVNFSVPNGYNVESVNCVLTGICKDCSIL
ncbi:transcriptional repressor [Elizabethkingia bruuniana]|uniref:Fur family transcriptional regulator, ferric uptake regulator n=4 Tax=Weeksellaceae TaxID=2762318 RepID=A0A1G7QVK4_9FLAO|nr:MULTISPECIES: transcriptional repressor [Bacteroidota]KGO11062.1 transcriptional regulator [Elizabethkingia miricola]MDV3778134.1 transcriptional regulator [Elizabethkingia anophelis]AQX83517.1 transcriptional regulator [Elizabethkingia bruuniana]EFK36975.1 transcriptional regulator, Fur family [Chryseobacterium gleum ATCC 35910]KUY21726.1 transcriptional regulator [Elizabethkingia bruuniana]